MIKSEHTVALTACSDPLLNSSKGCILRLKEVLEKMSLGVLYSERIFEGQDDRASGREKAKMLMNYYENPKVEAIFDVSGGNLANELLPFLDFKRVEANHKPFFGYSDLTVLLNAIYGRTGQKTVLYQVKNLVGECGGTAREEFFHTFLDGGKQLFQFPFEFFQGSHMEGIVAGGNIRCLLKLAGTGFFPDMKGKILFLESLSGSLPLHISQFYHLLTMGVFDEIDGLLLGTFTELEKNGGLYAIREVLRAIPFSRKIPIAKTWSIGHGRDSKALMIGGAISLHA